MGRESSSPLRINYGAAARRAGAAQTAPGYVGL